MTILNTSLVLEALKPAPSQVVLDWLNRQTPEAIYLTAVSLAELLTGVEALPSGRRRLAMEQAATPLSPRLHASSAWGMHVHHGPDRQDLGKVPVHEVPVVNQPNACGAVASGFACYFLQVSLAFTGRVLPTDRRE